MMATCKFCGRTGFKQISRHYPTCKPKLEKEEEEKATELARQVTEAIRLRGQQELYWQQQRLARQYSSTYGDVIF